MGVRSNPSTSQHFNMGSLSLPTLAVTSWIFLGLTVSDEALHETHLSSESQHQPLAAPYYNYNQAEVASDLASPYYPDYTYSQPSGPTALSSVFSLERQGEAVFTFPLILTAFIAALFGGFLSPLISQGLASLRQYEIRMPQIVRRNETETTTETARMFDFIQQLTEDNERVKRSAGRWRRKDM